MNGFEALNRRIDDYDRQADDVAESRFCDAEQGQKDQDGRGDESELYCTLDGPPQKLPFATETKMEEDDSGSMYKTFDGPDNRVIFGARDAAGSQDVDNRAVNVLSESMERSGYADTLEVLKGMSKSKTLPALDDRASFAFEPRILDPSSVVYDDGEAEILSQKRDAPRPFYNRYPNHHPYPPNEAEFLRAI